MKTLDDIKAAAAKPMPAAVKEVVLPTSGVFARVRRPDMREQLTIVMLSAAGEDEEALAFMLSTCVTIDAPLAPLKREDVMLLVKAIKDLVIEGEAKRNGADNGQG